MSAAFSHLVRGTFASTNAVVVVLVTKVILASFYLRNSWQPIGEFYDTIQECRNAMAQAKSMGGRMLLAGLDGQIELPPAIARTTGPALSPHPPLGQCADADARRDALLQMATDYDVYCGNSFMDTRIPTRRSKILDYVWIPQGWHSRCSVLHKSLKMGHKSDHAMVLANIPLQEDKLTRKPWRGKSLRGWKPKNLEALTKYKEETENFMQKSAERLHACEKIDEERLDHPDMRNTKSELVQCLGEVEAHLVARAEVTPHTTAASRAQTQQLRKPEALIAAEKAIQGTWGPVREQRMREKRRLWRQFQARIVEHQAKNENRRQQSQVKKIRCEGELTEDRTRWAMVLDAHTRRKYDDESFTMARQYELMQALLTEARVEEQKGLWSPPLDMSAVCEVRARMVAGKAGGHGRGVHELLKALSWTSVACIKRAFVKRFRSHDPTPIASWSHNLLVLLPKTPALKELETQTRGITLQSVVAKWYLGALIVLIARQAETQMRIQAPTVMSFGYEKSLSTEDITEPLRHMGARAAEWGTDLALHIFVGDVYQAFDNLSIPTAAWGMRETGVHPRLTAAMLRETMQNTCEARFQDIETTQHWDFNACIRQGGREGPSLWKITTKAIMLQLEERWRGRGWGFTTTSSITQGAGQPMLINHMIWSDNIILLAHSCTILQAMVEELTQLLNEKGLSWKANTPGKAPVLAHLACGADPGEGLSISQRGERLEIPSVLELELLGVKLSTKMATQTAFAHRLERMRAAFFRDIHFYRCRGISLQKKFDKYAKVVRPTLLHGAGGWSWTQKLAQSLRSAEGFCLRTMLGMRKPKDMPWKTYFRTRTREARRRFMEAGYKDLCVCVVGEIWRLAGKVAARARNDITAAAHRLLPAAHLHCDKEWRDMRTATSSCFDPTNTQRWKRRRAGKPQTRWTELLEKWGGSQWWAMDREGDAWDNFLYTAYDMINERKKDQKKKLHEKKPAPPQEVAAEAEEQRMREKTELMRETWLLQRWRKPAHGFGVPMQCGGDRLLVINWMLGLWHPNVEKYKRRVGQIQNMLEQNRYFACPAEGREPWLHIFREWNAAADRLTHLAREGKETWSATFLPCRPAALRGCFDGGVDERGTAYGFEVQYTDHLPVCGPILWRQAAVVAKKLPFGSVTEAELTGAEQLMRCMLEYAATGTCWFTSEGTVAKRQRLR